MLVVLVHSHDFRFLPYQVQQVRRCLPECTGILVAQGGGPIRLTEAGAEALGIRILTVPTPRGASAASRQPQVYRSILSQTSGLRLIIHGDCLPIQKMTAEELLAGSRNAGRASIYNGKVYPEYTWLLTSENGLEAAVENFHTWAAKVDDEELHTELCLPGFWHLDKVSYGIRLDEKLAVVQERFGTLPSPDTEAYSCDPPPIVLPILPPATPQEATEEARREKICRGCDRWDPVKDGCSLLKPCDRYGLTRVYWRKGNCRLGRWLQPSGIKVQKPQAKNSAPSLEPRSISEFIPLGTSRYDRIIFIFSAAKFADRLELCERTWIRDARECGLPVLVVKCMDDSTQQTTSYLQGSVLWVNQPDTIDSLPSQFQEVCAWALLRDDWRWLFKCDDDTFVSIPRFIALQPSCHYWGQRLRPGFGHGGAGYGFSRQAAKVLLERLWVGPGAKDRKVGDILRGAGMPITNINELKGAARTGGYPLADNSIITSHYLRRDLWLRAWKETGLSAGFPLERKFIYPEIPETQKGRRDRIRRERLELIVRCHHKKKLRLIQR